MLVLFAVTQLLYVWVYVELLRGHGSPGRATLGGTAPLRAERLERERAGLDWLDHFVVVAEGIAGDTERVRHRDGQVVVSRLG